MPKTPTPPVPRVGRPRKEGSLTRDWPTANFRCEPELKDWLVALAHEERRSVSETVRQLLRDARAARQQGGD